MKFKDVLNFLKPAASIAASFIPGGAALVGAINEMLPENAKLPETATGGEVLSAFEKLPPDVQVSLKGQETRLAIAEEEGWTSRYTAMTAADGQSTRPKIAYMLAEVLCFEIIAFTAWCFIYPEQMKNPILWTVFGSLTTAPAGLLAKYFGELRKEQGQRTTAVSGVSPSLGFIGSLLRGK